MKFPEDGPVLRLIPEPAEEFLETPGCRVTQALKVKGDSPGFGVGNPPLQENQVEGKAFKGLPQVVVEHHLSGTPEGVRCGHGEGGEEGQNFGIIPDRLPERVRDGCHVLRNDTVEDPPLLILEKVPERIYIVAEEIDQGLFVLVPQGRLHSFPHSVPARRGGFPGHPAQDIPSSPVECRHEEIVLLEGGFGHDPEVPKGIPVVSTFFPLEGTPGNPVG